MLDIFIDADGCPVKDEVYRVAYRHELRVSVVANKQMRVPLDNLVKLVIVEGGFDVADDWIAAHAGEGDIVITADIPLASRAIERGARVLDPKGREFTSDSIGDALATRELMSQLRDMGSVTGGPAPFNQKDCSRFLARLEEVIQSVKKRQRAGA